MSDYLTSLTGNVSEQGTLPLPSVMSAAPASLKLFGDQQPQMERWLRESAFASERAAELERDLRANLEVDHVLSVPQVLSLAGMVIDHHVLASPSRPRPEDEPWLGERAHTESEFAMREIWGVGPLSIFELVVASVWNVASSVVSVDVVCDWPMLLRYKEHRIAHLLGAAQARIDLGAGLDEWHSDAAAVGETERPDAFWYPRDGGEIAVEYDTGAYSREVIARKVNAFERFDGVVWACSSDRRRRRLRRELGPLGYKIINVDWWSPRVRALAPTDCIPYRQRILQDGWHLTP